MRIVAVTTAAGPYIIARYRRFAELYPEHQLTLVEFGRVSNEYAWVPWLEEVPFRRVVLSEGSVQSQEWSKRNSRIREALTDLQPDALVVCGYGVTGMGAALQWARTCGRNVLVVMLSESTAIDQTRSWWKEYLKRRVIAQCGSALVGGSRHRAYMVQLGMPNELIFEGYDVVDNGYFERTSESVRAGAEYSLLRRNLPREFFLVCARFLASNLGVGRPKNLHRLIEAYRGFREITPSSPWGLVLMGDGELRSEVESQIRHHGLSEHVQLVGFKQYDELPAYYALAGAFIHPSVTEPWGLVVNEAMACGLPVIVSDRCGCAPILFRTG